MKESTSHSEIMQTSTRPHESCAAPTNYHDTTRRRSAFTSSYCGPVKTFDTSFRSKPQLFRDTPDSVPSSSPLRHHDQQSSHPTTSRTFNPGPVQPFPYRPKSILKKLTHSVSATYKSINENFNYTTTKNPRRVLTQPSEGINNDGFDNADFDYILSVNDIIGDKEGQKFKILDVLGQGTFGQVVKCENCKSGEMVAVKVIKNKPAYFNQSMMEVTILELINLKYDPQNRHNIARLRDTFVFRRHLCLVFELLSINLYELIKQNQYRGFVAFVDDLLMTGPVGVSLKLLRIFVTQILDALLVLNQAQIIHCDLKPENILLRNLESPAIKVIDFGSACHEQHTVYPYIQSRFYRSPEVLVGLPYSSSIDIWSLGCIAVELFLGLPLFPGSSEFNQISRITTILGLPPAYMLEFGKSSKKYFNRTVNAEEKSVWSLKSLEQYNQENNLKEGESKKYFKSDSLREIIMSYPIHNANQMTLDAIQRELYGRECFLDFIGGLLVVNPVSRWSPHQSKLHPFISMEPWVGPFQQPMFLQPRVSKSATTVLRSGENLCVSEEPDLPTSIFRRPRANTLGSLKFSNITPQLKQLSTNATNNLPSPPSSTNIDDRTVLSPICSKSYFPPDTEITLALPPVDSAINVVTMKLSTTQLSDPVTLSSPPQTTSTTPQESLRRPSLQHSTTHQQQQQDHRSPRRYRHNSLNVNVNSYQILKSLQKSSTTNRSLHELTIPDVSPSVFDNDTIISSPSTATSAPSSSETNSPTESTHSLKYNPSDKLNSSHKSNSSTQHPSLALNPSKPPNYSLYHHQALSEGNIFDIKGRHVFNVPLPPQRPQIPPPRDHPTIDTQINLPKLQPLSASQETTHAHHPSLSPLTSYQLHRRMSAPSINIPASFGNKLYDSASSYHYFPYLYHRQQPPSSNPTLPYSPTRHHHSLKHHHGPQRHSKKQTPNYHNLHRNPHQSTNSTNASIIIEEEEDEQKELSHVHDPRILFQVTQPVHGSGLTVESSSRRERGSTETYYRSIRSVPQLLPSFTNTLNHILHHPDPQSRSLTTLDLFLHPSIPESDSGPSTAVLPSQTQGTHPISIISPPHSQPTTTAQSHLRLDAQIFYPEPE